MDNIKPKLIGGIPNNLSETSKKVIVYVDQYNIDLDTYDHNSYDFKVYWQIECSGIVRKKHNNISFASTRKDEFDLILASNPLILEKCENSVLFPFGDCWIPNDQQKIYEKTKLVSIISSAKRTLPGHQLRHEVMSSVGSKLDIYGKCCNFIENKLDGLKDYKFNISIENLQETNWFTEKLIDVLRTGTVPIYWGCPNIGEYFNTKGFIVVNSLEEIVNVVNNLTDEDYISRKEYIKENFDRAERYNNFNLFDRVNKEIKKIIK